MNNETNTPDELRQAAGQAVRVWALELAQTLTPDDSWRLLLAGAIKALYIG